MLQFIVLGQIPGTEVRINFLQLAMFLLLAVFFMELYLKKRRKPLESTAAISKPANRSLLKSKTAKPAKKLTRKANKKTSKARAKSTRRKAAVR